MLFNRSYYCKLKNQMENIVLIGMPGCGKSTVGKLLSEITGKQFVDADSYLVEKYGRRIPEIFAADGEDGFRAMETEVLTELGKQSGLIIATGGGCVTQERNFPLLHQNGRIFWLQRELSLLPVDGRPLSQTTDLSAMFAIRKPLYARFADHIIDVNCDPNTAATAIFTIWEENQ